MATNLLGKLAAMDNGKSQKGSSIYEQEKMRLKNNMATYDMKRHCTVQGILLWGTDTQQNVFPITTILTALS